MEKWTCTCGAENTSKFCETCGKKRSEAAEDIGANEQPVMTQVAETSVTTHPVEKPVTVGVSPKKKPTKGLIAAVVVVVLALVAYFGYGKYIEHNYEAQCDSYAAALTEVDATIKSIGELSGDKDEEARQTAIDELTKELATLDGINDYFKEGKLPDNAQLQREELTSLVGDTLKLVMAVKEMVAYDESITGGYTKSDQDFDARVGAVANWTITLGGDCGTMSKLNITFAGKNPGQILDLSVAQKVASQYANNKRIFDRKVAAEKAEVYAQKVEEENKALLEKKEVVFLRDAVRRLDNNTLAIAGVFHNGTDEYVSGIQGMLVDVTLKKGDTEVLTIKDYAYEDASMASWSIAAGQNSWRCNLRIPAEIKDVTYDNADVTVHKIRWKVRKLVKK